MTPFDNLVLDTTLVAPSDELHQEDDSCAYQRASGLYMQRWGYAHMAGLSLFFQIRWLVPHPKGGLDELDSAEERGQEVPLEGLPNGDSLHINRRQALWLIRPPHCVEALERQHIHLHQCPHMLGFHDMTRRPATFSSSLMYDHIRTYIIKMCSDKVKFLVRWIHCGCVCSPL